MMSYFILYIVAICSAVGALENPIPSSFLPPRNFNPHPYQEDSQSFLYSPNDVIGYQSERDFAPLIRRFLDTGPILFPDDSSNNDPQQVQQMLENQQRVLAHIVQNQALIPHPYERLALKHRAQQLQRYGNDNQTPQIFAALANHARKVNNNELQQQQQSPIVPPRPKHVNRVDLNYLESPSPIHHVAAPPVSLDDHHKKQYRFSYAVKDGLSGDDFSHTQKQENGAVHGSYRVHMPDGRVQIVKYTADDVHGYRADVSYEGEATEPHQVQVGASIQVAAPIQVQHKAAAVFNPTIFNPSVQIASGRHTVTPSPNYATRSIKAPNARKYFRARTLRPIEYYKK